MYNCVTFENSHFPVHERARRLKSVHVSRALIHDNNKLENIYSHRLGEFELISGDWEKAKERNGFGFVFRWQQINVAAQPLHARTHTHTHTKFADDQLHRCNIFPDRQCYAHILVHIRNLHNRANFSFDCKMDMSVYLGGINNCFSLVWPWSLLLRSALLMLSLALLLIFCCLSLRFFHAYQLFTEISLLNVFEARGYWKASYL